MKYVIEKDKPAPTETKGGVRKYPFAEMEIGDSILVEGESACSNDCKACVAAMQHGRRYGKKFSGRKEPGKPGYVRIWRIE